LVARRLHGLEVRIDPISDEEVGLFIYGGTGRKKGDEL
jgi:hypothetical protein